MLVNRWLLCKTFKGILGEKVIKCTSIYFCYIFLDREPSIWLVVCFSINLLLMHLFWYGSLVAVSLYLKQFLLNWNLSFVLYLFAFFNFRELFQVCREIAVALLILTTMKTLQTHPKTEACCHFDPARTDQQLSFDRRARGPALKSLSSLRRLPGWHFPHFICFNEFTFLETRLYCDFWRVAEDEL